MWLADRGFVGDETLLYAVFMVIVVVVFRGRGLADALQRLWRWLVVVVEPGDRPAGETSDDTDLDAVQLLEPFRARYGGGR